MFWHNKLINFQIMTPEKVNEFYKFFKKKKKDLKHWATISMNEELMHVKVKEWKIVFCLSRIFRMEKK